jgi:hypothetical protein
MWNVDEETRTATLVHDADLGYSVAVGSSQRLKTDGNSFEAGFINRASPYARDVETGGTGNIVYARQVEGIIVYRSFRVDDIYSAPVK